ncbi:MAG: potassium-transporting ATPase subunit KdpC [bacterium]|nr:potassium-transporting ATPase subunit KdpC [bacterium]
MRTLHIALRALIVFTLLTGVVYPLLVTAVGGLCFPRQASGSLVTVNGMTVGSELVGQKFTDPGYFWSRPSAVDYNPLPSGGSNLGPTSAALKESIVLRRTVYAETGKAEIPADLLCASASGLDPDISPEAARYQVDRVALARLLDQTQKSALLLLIDSQTEYPAAGIFGQPRINVLRLNLAVDSLVKASR